MAGDVRLTPVDEQTLEPLLSVAIAETEPHEVMPPVKAPAGWSQVCREAFREFYRSSYGGLDGPTRTLMYAIICDGDVVGMIRMARRAEPDTMETGMWVMQSARGQGIGVAALRLLLAEAARAGSRRVVAETTYHNTAALGVLRRCGAVLRDDGAGVRAEIPLGPDGTLPDGGVGAEANRVTPDRTRADQPERGLPDDGRSAATRRCRRRGRG